MSDELTQVSEALRAGGLHAALALLNARTVHRFTGIYRYDGDTLRNVALFDRFAPDDVEHGADAPMVAPIAPSSRGWGNRSKSTTAAATPDSRGCRTTRWCITAAF